MYIANFNFLAQFGGELGEKQHFFWGKKWRGEPRDFLLKIPCPVVFIFFQRKWKIKHRTRKFQIKMRFLSLYEIINEDLAESHWKSARLISDPFPVSLMINDLLKTIIKLFSHRWTNSCGFENNPHLRYKNNSKLFYAICIPNQTYEYRSMYKGYGRISIMFWARRPIFTKLTPKNPP